MNDSTMEMTTVCSTGEGTKLQVISDSEKSEMTCQENYELKKKIDVLVKVNLELENDITHLTHLKAKETTRLLNLQEELESANAKIKKLESSLEEERMQSQRILQEAKESRERKQESNVVVVSDQEQLNTLSLHIEKLEMQREEDQQAMEGLLEDKAGLMQKLNELSSEKQALQNELQELKEHLEQKTIDLRNVNSAVESLREEKFLLSTEIQMLKSSDSNAPRGNSLFAEVEENRQKVAAQREVLKLKYLNLKKVLNQKQVENNKLKLEIVKIRREEKEDEKSVHNDYSILIETYKQRVWELEERIKEMEQKASQPPIVLSDSDNSQWMWVNTVVENARQETKTLQEELDRRSSNYVTQGHQLLTSQKENRKLKAANVKLQSDIDELRLRLDLLKSENENAEDQDGISPPATEVAVEYQKQKIVRFKEAMRERHNNSRSESNTSSSDRDTSVNEQKSSKETNISGIKEENKENIDVE